MPVDQYSPAERSIFRRLTTPAKIQLFLDGLDYNLEPEGPTCLPPRKVLRLRTAHCMEGALLAAAALRLLGYEPLLVDLEAVRDDDHVLAVYRQDGRWGAVAKSNYSGLRFREPVYHDLRELVMSYFEHYFNLKGEKTLRRYSRPVNLRQFDRIHWMTTENDVWEIPEHLVRIPHFPLLTPQQVRRLNKVDERLFAAGLIGATKGQGRP